LIDVRRKKKLGSVFQLKLQFFIRNFNVYRGNRSMQWQSWLRLCAASWKVADLVQLGGWDVSNLVYFSVRVDHC